MARDPSSRLQKYLADRYSDPPEVSPNEHTEALALMASRGSCRAFQEKPVPSDLLQVLCATALAAPTKSDLQQRDIILLHAPEIRAQLTQLVAGQAWVAGAPMIAVFCGNNRRQRLVHDWQDCLLYTSDAADE